MKKVRNIVALLCVAVLMFGIVACTQADTPVTPPAAPPTVDPPVTP